MRQGIELIKDSSIIIMVLFAETVTEAHTQVIMYGIYQHDIKFMKVVALMVIAIISPLLKMLKSF